MRTWGRLGQVNGKGGTWTEVSTAPNGDNSAVYLTALVQVLKLNLGESPFFGNWGIPAQQSVISQVQPDYYINMTQSQFAQFFAALIISKAPQAPNQPMPAYTINATALSGAVLTGPIPT